MNRGVMVTRADPSEDELVFSAMGICSNDEHDPIRRRLEPYFTPFARAYKSICEKQEREFFGLRDFYRSAQSPSQSQTQANISPSSLIKMLYYMCQKSNRLPTRLQLKHAIKRNFGGLETKDLSPYNEFKKRIAILQKKSKKKESKKQLEDDVPFEVKKSCILQWITSCCPIRHSYVPQCILIAQDSDSSKPVLALKKRPGMGKSVKCLRLVYADVLA